MPATRWHNHWEENGDIKLDLEQDLHVYDTKLQVWFNNYLFISDQYYYYYNYRGLFEMLIAISDWDIYDNFF